LINVNRPLLENFLKQLEQTLDRSIESILLIPLHGMQNEFDTVEAAIEFIEKYDQGKGKDGDFRKYEVIVRYSNGDKIDASFGEKMGAVAFLKYVEGN
jgi:regulator of PEP synthase PpsR (kinase-PPPase family)